MVKYRYNAWGTATQVITQGCEELDVLYNPFKFKGYFYDGETGFYYLKTRYYAPIIGKFISMDSINYMDIKSLNGVNLYAYCNNNPIMYADPNGHAWYNVLWDWVNIIAGFLNPISTITALGSIAVAAIDGRWGDVVDDWKNGRINPFNRDAKLAGEAKVLSFYKGSTVINQNIVSTCSAFGTIWKVGVEDAETIMHEYGHSIQERLFGLAYWFNIAIPSMLYFKFGSKSDIDYYSTPWERTADWLGGVNRKSGYKNGSLAWAIAENLFGPIVIPFYFWFGY